MIKPFEKPILVTRPLLPNISDLFAELQSIWDEKWLTNMGPKHKVLEEEIQQFLKVRNCCLFNNGTIALIVALQSLELSGEVLTTPFTFAATPHVLKWNNLKPVFCDINPDTLTIDPLKIEQHITKETSAILGVHVYGTPCHVNEISEIAKKYNLKTVYDAAHAFGVEIDNVGIGNFGDISMFSFHATKLFHTAEGGALTFNDLELKNKINLLKNFGIKNEEEVILPGINGKMNEIQASIGLLVIKLIEDEKIKRQALKNIYLNRLDSIEGIYTIKSPKQATDSLQYMVIRIDDSLFGESRDQVYNRLREYNVFSRKYFYPLCSNFSCYKDLDSASIKNLPIANKISNQVLCLPFYGELTDAQINDICDIILLRK